MSAASPQIALEEIHRSRSAKDHRWRFEWRIQNLTNGPMEVQSARLPHGKFRGGKKNFDPPLIVPAGNRAVIEMLATCSEAPGTIVENAFIILSVEWGNSNWRIFARLRIEINQAGEPQTRTELITAQPVGFSGVD